MSDPYASIAKPVDDPYASISRPVKARATPAAPKKSGVWDQVGAFAQSATEQIPFLDEAAAWTAAKLTGSTYEQMRGRQNELAAEDRAQRPLARNAGGVAGFATGLVAPGGGYVRGANSLAQATRRSAGVGAAYGALYGAGAAEDGATNRLAGGVSGAATGAAFGAAVPAAANVVRRAVSGPKAKPATPQATTDRLKTERKALYDQAEASGFRFQKGDLTALADEITAEVRKRGGPKAAQAFPDADAMTARLRALAKEPGGVSISQLDLLRRDIYDVMVDPGGKEAFLGKAMRRKIDDLMARTDAPHIREARAANVKYEKAKAVTDRVRSAELAAGRANSGENYGNAVRQKISPLIDPLHSAQLENATPDEVAALERVVVGDRTQNALRQWGNRLRNPMWTGAAVTPAALVGAVSGGPVGAATAATMAAGGMQGVGQILRLAAEKRTDRNVQAVVELIARGGKEGEEAAKLLTAPAYASLRAVVVPRLGQYAGQSTGSGQQSGVRSNP